jgi:hypothetical protein
MSYTDAGQSQRDEDVGTSSFRLTEVSLPTINRERERTHYSAETKAEGGPVVDFLDMIWQVFGVADGQSFADSVIIPLTGNYNSIKANGDAWQQAGLMFGSMAATIGANAVTLLTEHWQGQAADMFSAFVTNFWTRGAVYAGEQVGKFLASGFTAISEFSKKLAEAAMMVIRRIFQIAQRLLTKAIPGFGQAKMVLEFVGKAVGLDVDTIIDDVNRFRALYKQLDAIYRQIGKLVESVGNYFTAFDQVVQAIAAIPTIDSTTDIAEINTQLATSDVAMTNQVQDMKGTLKQGAYRFKNLSVEAGKLTEDAEQTKNENPVPK